MPRITLPPECINRVYRPHLENEERYQLYFGGAGSGKSVFLATRCVLDVLRGRNYLIVRKVGRTLRSSCWNEILKAIDRLGLRSLFRITKTDGIITAENNGCQLFFAGLDDVEKIKSLTPLTGVLTDVWMEEATECTYEDFKQLDKRLRGESRHKKRFTLSFNPVYQRHWIFRQFFDCWQDGKMLCRGKNVSILKTTYRDNRFLTPDDRQALESEQDPYFYQVYTLGNWGVLGDVIFRNWQARDLTEERNRWTQFFYGLDFGFAKDPCAAVCCALDRKNKRVYVFAELYEKGLINARLADRLKDFCGHTPIVCDSAEPKSIQELRSLGIHALAAKKGKDSVLHGIQWLQGHEIVVDVKCTHLKEELSLYRWQQDQEGRTLPIPQDKHNHLIDALRYALEHESTCRRATTAGKGELGL